jgi:hypothetical protein
MEAAENLAEENYLADYEPLVIQRKIQNPQVFCYKSMSSASLFCYGQSIIWQTTSQEPGNPKQEELDSTRSS